MFDMHMGRELVPRLSRQAQHEDADSGKAETWIPQSAFIDQPTGKVKDDSLCTNTELKDTAPMESNSRVIAIV